MKSYYIIISLLISTFCFPQIDTTKKDFYPLKIGNLWQYRNESNYIITEKIISDTIIDGYFYYSLVNVNTPTFILPVRIDSILRVIIRHGGPFWGDTCGGNTPYESSVYHLNAEDSAFWKICDGLFLEQFVRFNGIRTRNIFGQPHEIMEFDYGGIANVGDTIWFYGARLAKGIGLLEERHYEWSYNILQGAIIDGIQYGAIVSIGDLEVSLPVSIVLHQNFPNPFNPYTTIKYEIPERSNVILKVYNTLGQEIITLTDDTQSAGIYEKEFNGNELSSGVYFAVLTTNQTMFVSKMLLLK
ncbi:MAG TPA: hypothetical protein DHV28_14155 [Ignavibacteriales bacterium]|nr:hypothetical protein [Ignavibacteriales bacterium]